MPYGVRVSDDYIGWVLCGILHSLEVIPDMVGVIGV